jgi:hypothetical protein
MFFNWIVVYTLNFGLFIIFRIKSFMILPFFLNQNDDQEKNVSQCFLEENEFFMLSRLKKLHHDLQF